MPAIVVAIAGAAATAEVTALAVAAGYSAIGAAVIGGLAGFATTMVTSSILPPEPVKASS